MGGQRDDALAPALDAGRARTSSAPGADPSAPEPFAGGASELAASRPDGGLAGSSALTPSRLDGLLAGEPEAGQPDHRSAVMALVFEAGPLYCALPLDEVVETMRPLRTRALAGTPPYVCGLTILRGAPAPVIDVTRLLTGTAGEIDRYIAVRAGRGPIACATGPVLGVREIEVQPPEGPAAIFTGVSKALIAGVGSIGTEPLLLLRGIRAVPDEVWEAAGAALEAAT